MGIVHRVLSAVLAFGVLVGGVVVAIEIVGATLNRPPWLLPYDRWYRSARQHSWGSAAPRWLFIALVLAGLVLLGLQLVGRRRVLVLGQGESCSPGDLGRRSLKRSLRRAAADLDGVTRARARVSPKRVKVIVTSDRSWAEGLEARLAELVDGRIRSLDLAQAPRLRVRVRARRHR